MFHVNVCCMYLSTSRKLNSKKSTFFNFLSFGDKRYPGSRSDFTYCRYRVSFSRYLGLRRWAEEDLTYLLCVDSCDVDAHILTYFTIKNALHLFARSLMLHTTAHKRNKSSQKKRSKVSTYGTYEYKIFTHTHILSAHPMTKKIIRPISQIASCVPKETTRK